MVKPVTREMRWMLLIGSALPFLAGLSLFVGTNETGTYSAWTIDSAITAAFIGGAYWGGFFLTFLSGFERTWARARVAIPAVLAFTTLNLISTIIHFDIFHTDSDSVTTQVVTWLWLVPYGLGLVALLVIVARQLRLPGEDEPRTAPLPGWTRAVLVVQALVLAGVGAALFIAPADVAESIWPWELTPLTARVAAAWLVALGVGAAHVALENDWLRARAAAVSYVVIAVLEFAVLARYSGDVDWEGSRLWLYVAFLASMLAVGLYGWAGALRAGADQVAGPVGRAGGPAASGHPR